ncbi:DUF397 domain-containing protein [Streptomyces calidiresistens]|uniref:DUF397 domain-containing protein n=1 Tax=Streptomyces calidiresistens TaxID=1485586 RepID=A0A7W3XV24_9ACTN|nr:DUF397 domain-containing protein [Streptomyces calidiresistens]
MSETPRRKSTHSGNDNGNRLEVRDDVPATVPVRDGKRPEGPVVNVPAVARVDFVDHLGHRARARDREPARRTPARDRPGIAGRRRARWAENPVRRRPGAGCGELPGDLRDGAPADASGQRGRQGGGVPGGDDGGGCGLP